MFWYLIAIGLKKRVTFKEAGNPERKYMLKLSENCFGRCSDKQSIKDGLGRDLGNRDDAVKQYKNT